MDTSHFYAHAAPFKSRWEKALQEKELTSIFYYRDTGYLPEAFLNFLTLMGYSMPNDQEVYTLDEVIKSFDPKRIGVSEPFLM